ncbi:MAG: hypothetical protein FJ121_11740 [Deltaproteobacteria bacterium]|nr:hypothetical protein [Deltaproteobacteria bacterium]
MNQEAIEAVRKLVQLGYRLTVNGEIIKAKYHGPGKPDPEKVRPLLETVKAHKPDVLVYLNKPAMSEHILTCADCSFHEYQGPNPAHGWGRCTFNGKGCYGLRRACSDIGEKTTL